MSEKITDNELLEAVVESSIAGFFVLDALGDILTVNGTGERMFGYDIGELKGMSMMKLIPKSKHKALADRLKNPTSDSIPIVGMRKTGTTFALDIRIVHNRLKGQLLNVVYCKPAETSIFESDRRLRTLVSNVDGIVYSSKPDSSRTMEFISEACHEISGYRPQQFYGEKGLNWSTLIFDEDRDRIKLGLEEAILKNKEYQFYYRILTANKRIKWILERGSCVEDNDGNIIRIEGFMQDITEQMGSRLALTKEKMRLHQYLDSSASIFLVVNKDHRIELINKKGCEILGFEQDALLHKNWFKEFIPSNKREELTALFNAIIDGTIEPPDSYENFIVTANGEQRLIQWRNALLRNNENQIIGVISSGFDITETQAIEDTLHIRNRALEAAGNGIIIVDAQQPELPILYANEAFSKITGYSRSEVLGKNCRFLQNGDCEQPEIATMAKAIKKGEPARVVLRNYRKDGTLFWNDLAVTPLYDKNNKLTHFIGIQNDVTQIQHNKEKLEEYANKLEHIVEERTHEIQSTVQKLVSTNLNLEDQVLETKMAEKKAQLSQALFISIAHNFPKGVIMVFNTNYELVYLEGEELDRMNFNKSELQGLKIDDISFFSREQIIKIKDDIRKTLKGNKISLEVDFEDQNYAVNSTPLYSDHKKILWALFVYNNVTEQKQIQHKLERTLKAEQELNELKSRFISMASHEFRTPLSAILSSAILIGKQNEPGKEERRIKHVSRIKNNVKDLVVILNDFLSLSKLEEGKVRVKPQPLDLIQFIKRLLEDLELTKKKGQKIILSHSKPWMSVYLDPKLLNHILINLISNAIKYSNENQTIDIEIVGNTRDLIIHVKDLGIGIPEEDQDKLFQRFFRAENATNLQGTGLGLHIVKQYTELMGGSINFKSKPGLGSTFTLQLPLNIHENEKNTVN